MAGVLENAQPLRKHPQAPEHQRRVQRYRRERITGQPIGLSVSRDGRDNGDTRGKRAQRIAEIPWVNWRIVAGQLVGRIRRMLWRVGHPPPQTVRFSDGTPSATRPSFVPTASQL